MQGLGTHSLVQCVHCDRLWVKKRKPEGWGNSLKECLLTKELTVTRPCLPRARQVLVLVRSGVWHSLDFNRKARIAWVPGLYGNDLELRTHPNKDILSLGESKCGGRCFPTHGCGPVPLMGPPKDKVLLPNKLLHQCNNLDQMKSNWIRKGPDLVYTSAPRWSSRPPERTSGRKIMKPHVCSLGGNINIL